MRLIPLGKAFNSFKRVFQFSPSRRTESLQPTDWESEAVGLNTNNYWWSDCKKGMWKCPSLGPVTGLKGRCTKGWGHGRVIHSLSRLPPVFIFEPSRSFLGRIVNPFRNKIMFYFFWGGTNGTLKGRATGGILKVTPVSQTPCTYGFGWGNGTKGGYNQDVGKNNARVLENSR